VSRAAALAAEHRLTLYDAAYAAVAEGHDAILATLDRALLSAGLGERPSRVVQRIESEPPVIRDRQLASPDQLELSLDPSSDTVEAMVQRISRLGLGFGIECVSGEGVWFLVPATPLQVREMGLREGQIAYVRIHP
jgi:hypothetical protein